jgi:hypothetical protein
VVGQIVLTVVHPELKFHLANVHAFEARVPEIRRRVSRELQADDIVIEGPTPDPPLDGLNKNQTLHNRARSACHSPPVDI